MIFSIAEQDFSKEIIEIESGSLRKQSHMAAPIMEKKKKGTKICTRTQQCFVVRQTNRKFN